MTYPIELDGVWRAFDESLVLRGLSLHVREGEVYALLGRNGSGKTTAIRILLGLLRPMAGRASILGRDSRALDGATRERIGFVSEGHQLEAMRSVRATLEFEALTQPRLDRAFATDRVRRLGLPLDRRVEKLSRGQRAQLALVLQLARRPEILVFDDPAQGLDVVMRRELLDVLIDLLSQTGVPVLFTSHVMIDVERLADRIGILRDGRLIVDATRDDLRRRVTRRFLVDAAAPRPPDRDGLLAWRRRPEGLELTLLDGERWDDVAGISAPESLTLEDLFVDLTAENVSLDVLERSEVPA